MSEALPNVVVHYIGGKKVLMDKADEPLFLSMRWHINDSGYVVWRGVKDGRKKTLRFHRMIAAPQEGQVVDHINRNKLDNRRSNLRCVTQAENTRNREEVENAKGYYRSHSPQHEKRPWIVDFRGVSNTFKNEGEARRAVQKIKEEKLIKRKDILHKKCSKCGSEKTIYGGVWACRKCVLRRQKEYYRRAVASGKIVLHPREPKPFCKRGHPRTSENLTANKSCKICMRERNKRDVKTKEN